MTKKYISVFSGNSEDSIDWPSETPSSFLGWFAAKFNKIPDLNKSESSVILSGESSDGDDFAHINIGYYRRETADEVKIKIRNQKIIDSQNKKQELETIKRLVNKHYGPDVSLMNWKTLQFVGEKNHD